MKTPIQELIKHVHDYYGTCVVNDYDWIEKEKEFAKQCFEAGRKLEDSIWMDTLRALPEKQLDFEEFYKQFEQ